MTRKVVKTHERSPVRQPRWEHLSFQRWLASALLAVSLALPVGCGDEIFGVMRGYLFVLLPPLTLVYVPVLIGLMFARSRPALAVLLK